MERKYLEHARQVIVPLQPGSELGRSSPADTVAIVGAPMCAFLPLGLQLWGVTDETIVDGIRGGNVNEVIIGEHGVPGSWFTARRSFAEIERLIASGELLGRTPPRELFEMSELQSGQNVALLLKGPYDQGLFWGLTYPNGMGPTIAIDVTGPDATGQYRGVAISRALAGDLTLAEVTAPNIDACSALLGRMFETRRR